MNSTHKVEVVKLGKVEKHPDADTLDVSSVFGYSVVFKKGEHKKGDLVAFVPPDNIMPSTQEYEWLGPSRRVKAKKLRGIPSFGLLLKAPDWAKEGDDLTEYFGVVHYEPPIVAQGTGGEAEKGPKGYNPCYDVDSGKRYNFLFKEGELVNFSEKIHGSNGRFRYDQQQDRMFCGSKTEWKKPDDTNLWWRALKLTPVIENFCRANPDCTVYGEVAGQVQKGFDYGVPKGEVRIFVFDILRNGKWMDYQDARQLSDRWEVPWVPMIAENIPYDFEKICQLAEGKTLVSGANHIREGGVCSPIHERSEMSIGRLKLKFVSAGYLCQK